MPRLHVWAILGVGIPSIVYGCYNGVYLPRITKLQEDEMVLEAARFSTQQLFQRVRNVERHFCRTNSEKVRLYAELSLLRYDVESGKFKGVGYKELAQLLQKLNELEAVRCMALAFHKPLQGSVEKLRSATAYLLFCVWFLLFDCCVDRIWFFSDPQKYHHSSVHEARRWSAKQILSVCEVPVEFEDEERAVRDELLEVEHRRMKYEGTEKALPENPDEKPSPLLHNNELQNEAVQEPDIRFVSPPLHSWIEYVASASVLPAHARLHVVQPRECASVRRVKDQLVEGRSSSSQGLPVGGKDMFDQVTAKGRHGPSFGYPLPLTEHEEATTPTIYRPVLFRGVESVMAVPGPVTMDELADLMAEEERAERDLLSSPYGKRQRKRDASGRLERTYHEETNVERDQRMEKSSFSRRLFDAYPSDGDRLHVFDTISPFPLDFLWGSVAKGNPFVADLPSSVPQQANIGPQRYNWMISGRRPTHSQVKTAKYFHQKLDPQPKIGVRALVACQGDVLRETSLEGIVAWLAPQHEASEDEPDFGAQEQF